MPRLLTAFYKSVLKYECTVAKDLERSYRRFLDMDQEKLLLVAMDWMRSKDPPLSLGQASILTNLRKHSVDVLPKAWNVNESSFHSKHVTDFILSNDDSNTDVALGAFVWHEPDTQQVLKDLRVNNFKGRIILGGPQISYTKKNVESFYSQADIFIRGYAEDALTQLMISSKEKPDIVGVHYAGEEDLGRSANPNFEMLPSPFLEGIIKPQPFIRWETQRGCPFRCSFCQHRESDVSKTRRPMLLSRILKEIDWIIENPIIQDVAVLDPTFNSGPHYLQVIQAFIEGGYQGKLSLQCRAEMLNEEFLGLIELLNKTAHVVLELGLQSIHKVELMEVDRPTNMRKVQWAFQELKKRGIASEVSLIFGLPHQTVQSFQQSIDFCKSFRVPTIYAYPLMLLRGTPMYESKQRLGLVESCDVEQLNINRVQRNIDSVVASPTFTRQEWSVMAAMAEELDTYNSQNRGKMDTKMSSTLKYTSWRSN